MKVPLLDLKAQFRTIQTEVQKAMDEVLESQHFILGPQVKLCENQIAAYSQCAYGVGVSSGSDALLVTLMAENVGNGDEVITTPYTFFATAGCIARLGARPVFVDIDPATFNLRIDQIESKITPNTKVVLPVHLFGQMADMDPLMEIAANHNLVVIEDAAQAIGAEYKGRRAGSIGHYGCFSFFPSKNLGGFGDGGMVVTKDPARAERLAILRAHGSKPKYHHKVVGGNFRLDTLQAAVVLAKLHHLDSWTQARQANADRYDVMFSEAGLASPGGSLQNDNGRLRLPARVASRHIFNQYVIRTRRRDQLQQFLKEREIGSEIYYPVPMHLQECFSYLKHAHGDFPESELAASDSLAIPVFPELTEQQAQYVVESIAEFYSH